MAKSKQQSAKAASKPKRSPKVAAPIDAKTAVTKPPFLVLTTRKTKKATKSAPVKSKRPTATAPKITARLQQGRTRAQSWGIHNLRPLTLAAGSVVIVLWTLLRHISNGVNFDVVGQIGLAQQWAQGLASGAQLGTTSYLLKMPFYLLVNHLSFLSPMNRILVLATVFNVATFLLLFILFEKILHLYGVKRRSWLYLGMAWLATIAGGVFWIDYANSRNLETVCGVLVIYWALKYLRRPRLKTLIGLLLSASLAFFVDPLQLYVCGLGICLFAAVRVIVRRTKAATVTSLGVIGTLMVGYVISKLLFLLAAQLLPVTFLQAPYARPAVTLSTVLATLRAMVTSTLKAFDADFLKRPYGVSTLRELVNAAILVGFVTLLVTSFKRLKRPVVWVVLAIILANYIVYAVSGQALQWETSRYLIMVPIVTIILLVIRGDELDTALARRLQRGSAILIVISAVMLVGGLAISWPDRHAKDARIDVAMQFMEHHDFKYALSSREVGVTTTYFEQGKATLLPMACEPNHTLSPTNLFFDDAAFKGLYNYSQQVPIIIPAGGITFGSNNCTSQNIITQFGTPRRELAVPGIGTALVYNVSSLHIADIDRLIGHVKPDTLPAVARHIAAVAPASTLTPLGACKSGTLDVFVAHPDDDILFMNPSLRNRFAHSCIRTVYVTAGDGGHERGYWAGRQRGIEAAYASMAGVDNVWVDDISVINGHQILGRKLAADPSVGLLYLHLPDGGVTGQGFPATGRSSLEKLINNQVVIISPVDGHLAYNYAGLIELLSTIISTDKPANIFTQLSDGPYSVGDHSDHRAVGLLTQRASLAARSAAKVTTFLGYADNALPPNLSPEDTIFKSTLFLTYAREDGNICSRSQCSIDSTYGKYFSRSYIVDSKQNLSAAK